MMIETNSGSESSPSRSAEIEALVGRYPDLNAEELTSLKHWFNKEASSLDIALLASQESIRPGYRRFREEQVDRIGLRDWSIVIGLFAAVAAATTAAFFMLQ